MNKILTLLIVLVIVYQSFGPLLKGLITKRTSRKKYTLTFSKKLNHLFSSTLLLLIPLVGISNYYPYYLQFPFTVKIGLSGLVILCWVGALTSFYLYINYVRKTPYHSLVYDPNQFTIELFTDNNREIIMFNQVRGIKWYSIKNSLKMMPWSNFEYIALEVSNGKKIIIPSLIMAPVQLHTLLSSFEVVHIRKVIPTIK